MTGIDEATDDMSAGLTARIHFFKSESSFSLRLRIRALLGWSSLSAASTAWKRRKRFALNEIYYDKEGCSPSHNNKTIGKESITNQVNL